jgi:hypothetical protein
MIMTNELETLVNKGGGGSSDSEDGGLGGNQEFEGVDEDDPETYVNNDEKRTELDYERKQRNI